ncbi:amino acid transporter heavy chain SLC3A2 [Rhineura floridana]|uniref:amino acid transporter heavy chain SLC3A2 n=1 Tax=Rhineura floridana TaxID=261503 RepID=UPI002AC85A83|nr:amino acid transporter heavy chain SLC3A2 [Rhineura floridana]
MPEVGEARAPVATETAAIALGGSKMAAVRRGELGGGETPAMGLGRRDPGRELETEGSRGSLQDFMPAAHSSKSDCLHLTASNKQKKSSIDGAIHQPGRFDGRGGAVSVQNPPPSRRQGDLLRATLSGALRGAGRAGRSGGCAAILAAGRRDFAQIGSNRITSEAKQRIGPGDIMTSPGVTPDTELDMKDVELNEMETEKQPMNASSPGSLSEKNGVVKVKVAEEEEEEGAMAAKFTGLSKEELLKVAGTPGWVRTRWALLILFWLGWLGMLAGAVAIIVQAPRCKDLPKQEWWQEGGIYRIQNVDGFQDSAEDGVGDLAGLKQQMDYLSSLKVKGLVIGPLHVNPKDNQTGTNLQDIDKRFGTLDDFREVLEAAKKKDLKVVLDLTPNYQSQSPWFSREIRFNSDLQDKMKEAIEFWLKEGVSGIQIGSVEHLNDAQILSEWKNLTERHSVESQNRVLIAVTHMQDAQGIFSLLNETTGVDLLCSEYLRGLVKDGPEDAARGEAAAHMTHSYIKKAGDKWPSWSVGRLAAPMGEQLLRLFHLLLYTLPGTPFTDYGDEIGLRDLPGQPAASSVIRMQWDNSANFGFSKVGQQQSNPTASNVTVQSQSGDKASVLSFFRQLGELRDKARSLLFGEFSPALSNSPSVFAYLRVWDQSQRYLVVLNFAPEEHTISITHPHLPAEVTVELSTHPTREEKQLSIQELRLAPSEGLLLSFPYVA